MPLEDGDELEALRTLLMIILLFMSVAITKGRTSGLGGDVNANGE